MSISQSIAPHLPYLRRFARAIAGSQSSGDAYALATLEAIVADACEFRGDLEPRVALYEIFLRLWGAVPVAKDERPDIVLEGLPNSVRNSVAGLKRLDALAPRTRVAFILRAIEGFNHRQIAQALNATPEETELLLNEAGLELSRQIATDILIIEDEPIIAMDIESLAQDLGHRVIDIARTHREAVAAAERRQPGLILADVQLADKSSGIEAVQEILEQFSVPVIFITAYPERLLTGERPEPTFLISKPFRDEMVKAVISQALFFDQRASLPRASAVARRQS